MDFFESNEDFYGLEDRVYSRSYSSQNSKLRALLDPGPIDDSNALRRFVHMHNWYCWEYPNYWRLMQAILDSPQEALGGTAHLLLMESTPTDEFLEVCVGGHRLVSDKNNQPIGTETGEASVHHGLHNAFSSLFYLARVIRINPSFQSKLISAFFNHPIDCRAAEWMMDPQVIDRAKVEFKNGMRIWDESFQRRQTPENEKVELSECPSAKDIFIEYHKAEGTSKQKIDAIQHLIKASRWGSFDSVKAAVSRAKITKKSLKAEGIL